MWLGVEADNVGVAFPAKWGTGRLDIEEDDLGVEVDVAASWGAWSASLLMKTMRELPSLPD